MKLSNLNQILDAVGASDPSWLQVIDADTVQEMGDENAVGVTPGSERVLPWRAPVATAPLIVPALHDAASAAAVKAWLCRFYPEDHLVHIATTGDGPPHVQSLLLHDLGVVTGLSANTALYIPPLAETDNVRTFAGMMTLTRTLRAPGGCPWDRDQTHASLKPHLLEEAYEVIDALDSGDPEQLAEELGDLLFQVTIHSQVAAEAGEFTIEDVIRGVMCKLIGRHPHVFGELDLGSAQDVLEAWESFKQREKPKRQSVLEEIPKGLPALPQSNLMQKRAASVGFEWPTAEDVIDKVEEELGELRHEIRREAPVEIQREELGDILFALVSVGRHLHIDPEEALRLANHKFALRFQHVERAVTADERSLRELSPVQLDEYWQRAKRAVGEEKTGE